MYCSFCGTALQVGVAQCPSCGSSPPYGAQEPGKVVYPPQQSGARPTARNNGAPPPSKLSDYKPGGTPISKLSPTPLTPNTANYNSASMPGIAPGSKLSNYSQAPGQPGKLSDYKQPAAQRSKLSDYKAGAKPSAQPPAAPNYIDISSMPTAGPASFNTAMTSPAPGAPSSPSIPPATHDPSGIQPVYPLAANAVNIASMANVSNLANPPSSVPAAERYTPNPALQAGVPPMNATPTKRGRQGGLLMGAIAIILLIICIGAASFFFLQKKNNHVAVVKKIAITPLPTIAPIHGPSGNTSVFAVSALFSEPQMTAVIDSNDKATQITNTFASGQTIYVTFNLNSKDQNGYVEARWYKGKQLFREVDFAHDPSKTNGYFSVVYDTPTTDGSVELYWSTTASLTDAKLARVAHFTVTK